MRATGLKKPFDLFIKKLMRATKKNTIYLSKGTCFFGMFFLSPKLTVFFRNRQQSDARWAEKKHMFFLVMRSLNLMRALI